jgi:hypothetical protein
MMKTMNISLKALLCATLLFCSTLLSAQNFEGWISYKMEMPNPFPEQISEEQFQQILKEQFGERGFAVSKIYYKGKNYMSELDMGKETGFQLYVPESKLLYSWQAESDTVTTVDTQRKMDGLKEVTLTDETETILGIECKMAIVKSNLGETKVWYNEDYLKMDAALYEGHVYGDWEAILEIANCIPLKIETKGLGVTFTLTATEYKAESVEGAKFILPEFKTVLANPMN